MSDFEKRDQTYIFKTMETMFRKLALGNVSLESIFTHGHPHVADCIEDLTDYIIATREHKEEEFVKERDQLNEEFEDL